MSELLLSPKYKAFLRCKATVEFLEGTTAAGKTTVGAFKFILKCASSPKKLHILSGLDLGTIEKNIINKELGIIDLFGELVEYRASGRGNNSLPHLLLHVDGDPKHDKLIYILGYDNKARWKKALGGQYGCLYIDEINIADMEYVREASMRCDYLLATLNPDDPSLPVYKEYINCSRPLPEWESETPNEILSELREEAKPGWVHWFFSFEHNPGLSPEKIGQIRQNVPKGTKLYKNKIQGLRGRATGLVFPMFSRSAHVKPCGWARQFVDPPRGKERFIKYTAGLDTSYSQKSPDVTAMTFYGITDRGLLIELEEQGCNNADLQKPLAPSDTAERLEKFLERCRRDWGFARNVWIDSADQATITELNKLKRTRGSIYNFNPAWKQMQIIDRIKHQTDWLNRGRMVILEHCTGTIAELESYSWDDGGKDNTPEDRNDHYINSGQYAWIPHVKIIGCECNGADKQNG